MPKKVPLVYDANCFIHIPAKFLNAALDTYDNKITSSVVEELKEHFLYSQTHPEHKRNIDLLFDEHGNVLDNFQIINLGPTVKTNNTILNNHQNSINLKEHPFICSSYYNLLANGYNPSSVLSPYDHIFNLILHKLNRDEEIEKELIDLEQKLKDLESQLLQSLAKTSDILQAIDPIKLLRVKKKRLTEASGGQPKIVDVQLIVSALLYSCIYGTKTCILTNDRDLIDLTSSLILSILEKFTLYEALSREINLDEESTIRELHEKGEINRFIEYDLLRSLFRDLIAKSQRATDDFFELIVLYYKAETEEIIPDVHKIPLWLRDFILEYKGNVDCYSLEPDIELKYPFKFICDPSKSKKSLYFKVVPRLRPFSDGFFRECEQICKYSRLEQTNPAALSDFITD